MKRLAAIVFLGVMMLSLLGVYGYFLVRLQQIHREMRAQLKQADPSTLTRVELPASALTSALVEEDEMRWQNRMFDIAFTEIRGATAIVYGVYDDDEDNLLSFIDTVLKNSLTDKKPVPNFGTQMEYTCSEWTELQFAPVMLSPTKTEYQFSVSELHRTIPVQPPRA